MPQFLSYSHQINDNPPRFADYRVLGQNVRIATDAPNINQAIADKLGITEAELQALEIAFDNLKAQVGDILTSLDADETERAADLAALSLADLATVRQIIGRGLQREAHSINQRRRLVWIVTRILRNFDWRQNPE